MDAAPARAEHAHARRALLAELDHVRDAGLAINNEELAYGLRSIAAPSARSRAGRGGDQPRRPQLDGLHGRARRAARRPAEADGGRHLRAHRLSTRRRKEALMEQQTPTQAQAGRRTKPPFRADHVGSLLRPPGVLEGARGFRRRADRRTTRCAPSRTTRSARSSASRRRSACSPRPTASSAARRGTWTSSTSSTGSRRSRARSRSSSTTRRATSSSRRPPCTSTASSASRRRSSATTSASCRTR